MTRRDAAVPCKMGWMSDPQTWMVCSACRKSIAFGAQHWVCSVSTCNRQRTRLVFCSVGCWDSHLSVLRQAGLVTAERRGQNIVYALDTTVFQDVVRTLLHLGGKKK